MKKFFFTVATLIFIIYSESIVSELNFNGTKNELYDSVIVAFEANTQKMLKNILIAICVGAIMCALFSDLVSEYFNNRKHKYYKSLAVVTPILYVSYILALITTSASNIGPMLFGGVLALWVAVYQGDEDV